MQFNNYRIQLQDGKFNMIYRVCASSPEEAFRQICESLEPYYNPEWGYKVLNENDDNLLKIAPMY